MTKPIKKYRKPRRPMTREEVDEVLQRARRGENAADIARDMNLVYGTVASKIKAWRDIYPTIGLSEGLAAKKSVLHKAGLTTGKSFLSALSRADLHWLTDIARSEGRTSLTETAVAILRDVREQEEKEALDKLRNPHDD